MKKLTLIYRTSLTWILSRKRRAFMFLLLSFGALALAIFMVLPDIPKEIISTPTSDRIVLFYRNSAISDPEVILNDVLPDLNTKIDAALGERQVQKFSSLSGRFNQTFIDLRSSQDTEEAIADLEKIFVSEGDWYYNVMSWDPAALPLPMSYDFQLSLFGPDPAVKIELLTSIQNILNEEEFYRRVFSRPSSTIRKQLNLTPREETIENFTPWSESSLSGLIRQILSGTPSINLSDGLEDVEVSAAYPPDELDSKGDLEDFLVPWKQSFVPLKHFFDFRESEGVSQIYSENGEQVFRLYGFAGFRISDSERLRIQNETEAYLTESLNMPEGYSFTFDNPRQELDDSIQSLFTALVISVVLIYLLLAFQFNSLRIPVIILVTIPLGFIGVIISLKIFNSTLNLNSLLGTILLGGIVVNNAIIMIDFYLKSLREYPDYRSALISTAAVRFQPILITTLTTIFGMLPLAIGIGEGSNILQPLGIAVSGGLFISTLLALFAVPSIIFLTHKEPSAAQHKLKGDKQ